MDTSIAFIGGGNMATSLIAGLLNTKSDSKPGQKQGPEFNPEQILVIEPDSEKRLILEQQFGIKTSIDPSTCVDSDTIILATKPQNIQTICRELAISVASSDQLFVSIAAGVSIDDIDRWLGGNRAIVRCMPNTPALINCGATALFANNNVNNDQKNTATNITKAVGMSLWVKSEAELDAVTAVSGSGPAYFFLLMEAMQAAGESLGLNQETAKKLTIQTALGAANMANIESDNPASLRKKVTSKGGTTEQAINSLKQADFQTLIYNALQAAYDRSQALAKELGEDQ